MITREKMKHILEYAKQHRHVGLHCKVPPADMVEIVELAIQSGNSAQPVNVPAGYVLVSADFIDTVKQAFKEVGDRKSFPHHSHDVPGVWDSDNGEKANKPCAQCALWLKLHDMLAAAPKVTP